MLNTTLVTNEIKNAAGVEKEFYSIQNEGRTRTYAVKDEPYNLRHRLDIAHRETGVGENAVRSSKVGFTKEVVGASGVKRKILCYTVMVIPIGDLPNQTEAKDLLANQMSYLSTTGAGTTVLFDGSGTGAQALLNGES